MTEYNGTEIGGQSLYSNGYSLSIAHENDSGPFRNGPSAVVGIKDGKIAHEHIYWDQVSVLVQLGLLDPAGLPVSGAEAARRILDPTLPSRAM